MNFDSCCQVSAQEINSGLSINEIPRKNREAILVVDDEEVVLEVTREILESLGYCVFTAESGREAIALYQFGKDTIDMVILDMIISGEAGADTFDALRLINPHVRVILSTGHSLFGQAKMIMAKGCNGFLQKPFRLEELSQKVREVLDQGELQSGAL
jgi:two-component system, cell cycle sensor histidine kinase and response regulator CckA